MPLSLLLIGVATDRLSHKVDIAPLAQKRLYRSCGLKMIPTPTSNPSRNETPPSPASPPSGPASSPADLASVMSLPAPIRRALAVAHSHLGSYGLQRVLLQPTAFRPLSTTTEMTLSANALKQLEVLEAGKPAGLTVPYTFPVLRLPGGSVIQAANSSLCPALPCHWKDRFQKCPTDISECLCLTAYQTRTQAFPSACMLAYAKGIKFSSISLHMQ